MSATNGLSMCPYCQRNDTPSREHIVPKTLGGRVTLDRRIGICKGCNNGVLSSVDRELCNRSYLSVVASREIDESVWHAWDVDHRDGNVFVEARPNWREGKLRSFVAYPQLTFERTGPELRGDALEVEQFGFDEFQRVLYAATKRCFQGYVAGQKRCIHFEKVPMELIGDSCRFPPRVYFRNSIRTVAHKRSSSCVLRFCTEEDKRIALRELSRLEPPMRRRNWTVSPSSSLPRFAINFDIGDTLRGMMKIGLNLLAYVCEETSIAEASFAKARSLVYGTRDVSRQDIRDSGFVRPSALALLDTPERAHKFRLRFSEGEWWIYGAYFGGAVGTFVRFPGSNREAWQTADVEMSLDTGQFKVQTYVIDLPIDAISIEWTQANLICPSIELISFASDFKVELTRRRKPK